MADVFTEPLTLIGSVTRFPVQPAEDVSCTLTLPEVPEKLTTIEFVPCPETMVAPAGTIYIYDTDGKLVLMHDFGSEKIITISVNELVSGMHFGRIVSGTAVQTFKFIKQ